MLDDGYQDLRLGLKAGSCAGVILTSVDALGTPPDLQLKSRQFSKFPSMSRADVPPMCPGRLADGA